jgi:glycosyltransferase involved in cell wall biosynthesis
VKKRVLQFISSFNLGGSESQAVALTRRLKNDGTVNVFAATLSNDGLLRNDMAGIGLPEIPEFPLTSFYNANFARQVHRCAKYLRDNQIDLVHTHDFYTNVFGMAAATLAGVPAWVASKRETGGVRTGAQKLVERIAFGRAKAIVANCEAVRESLIGSGVKALKIHTIYNGLDLSRFSRSARDRTVVCLESGLPTDENIRFVTMVANLRHKVKNVPMLLRTAKCLIESEPTAHIVIAGEGELEPDLREMARDFGVAQNVHFIGRCVDIPALLSVSYACVLTSAAEGFSNSILEYMAAGKPVVATNVGGAAEAIVENETGYLVESNDDKTMSNYLVKLLGDVHKAKEMGETARRTVESKFSSDIQLSKTTNLYDQCLSN